MTKLAKSLKFKGERILTKQSNLCLLVLVFALLAIAPAFAAQQAADIVDRANTLYRDGRYKQAIILYRKALDRGADPVAVSFNIANSYYQTEQYAEAAASYRKAVDYSNGKFAPALFNMASVFYRLKQYPECVAAYHRALKLEPENVSAWLFLGEAYSRTGDKVGALRAVEKAYHAKLAHRQNVLLKQVDRRTAIHTTLVTTYGLKYNEYSGDFTNVVTLEHLFA